MKLTVQNLELLVKAGAKRKELLAAFEVNLTQFLKFLRDECGVDSYSELVANQIERTVLTKPKFQRFVILSTEISDWVYENIRRQFAVQDIVQGISGNAYSDGKTIEGIYAALYDNSTVRVPLIPRHDTFTGSTYVVFELPKVWQAEHLFDVAMVLNNAIINVHLDE